MCEAEVLRVRVKTVVRLGMYCINGIHEIRVTLGRCYVENEFSGQHYRSGTDNKLPLHDARRKGTQVRVNLK